MASKKTIFYVILAFLFILADGYPPVLGLVLFIWVMGMAYFKYKEAPQDTGKTVDDKPDKLPIVQKAQAANTHAGQHYYSTAYSKKKIESRNAIKDKPLSEAERNVLYGK